MLLSAIGTALVKKLDHQWWKGRFEEARRALVVEAHDEQTQQRCARGEPTAAMVNALQQRRSEHQQAERALRRLEQEALAERVPLRDWH